MGKPAVEGRRGSSQWLLVLLVVGGLAALLGVGAVSGSDYGAVAPGTPAPDFVAMDVRTGDTVTLADYTGGVLLVNIWATWCQPCEEEMPSMQRLHEELGPAGLTVVAVSIDESDADHVLEWIAERDLTFDVLQDRSRRIERIYRTTGVPESFIVDRSGVIYRKQIGAWEWDQPAAQSLFRRLLATDESDPGGV